MRIAFVGKGGSGKTTMSALFTKYLASHVDNNIWLVDADINVHLSSLIGIDQIDPEKHLSTPKNQIAIKNYIKGSNNRIDSIDYIKKTTPPTSASGFFSINTSDNLLFEQLSAKQDNIYLSVVGTYEEQGIGTSCYHNNLSILENILSHSIDNNAYIVADMVAGTDAFAGSLHSQFDMFTLTIEPTKKSIAVFDQYLHLAKASGIDDRIFVIGNKVRDQKDIRFIHDHIPTSKLIGFVREEDHFRDVDQEMDTLAVEKTHPTTSNTLAKIHDTLNAQVVPPNRRLQQLYMLHKNYIDQGYVKDRFGDLSEQIDPSFDLEKYIQHHA